MNAHDYLADEIIPRLRALEQTADAALVREQLRALRRDTQDRLPLLTGLVDAPDRPATMSGDRLHAAARLIHQYLERSGENGEIGVVRELNEMAGLGEDWDRASCEIGRERALRLVRGMTEGASLIVMVPGDLAVAVAAAYAYGMDIGAFAALGIVDPNPAYGDLP